MQEKKLPDEGQLLGVGVHGAHDDEVAEISTKQTEDGVDLEVRVEKMVPKWYCSTLEDVREDELPQP